MPINAANAEGVGTGTEVVRPGNGQTASEVNFFDSPGYARGCFRIARALACAADNRQREVEMGQGSTDPNLGARISYLPRPEFVAILKAVRSAIKG